MKRYALGGTGSVLYLLQKLERPDQFQRGKQHNGNDEVFVRINGETFYLWRAVDHEGEVLEAIVTKRRNRSAALKLLKKAMKKYGNPKVIVTGKLRSYKAAMKVVGNANCHVTGRWLNNRTENSHQLFRR